MGSLFMYFFKFRFRVGLHNSENSKGQIININLLQTARAFFISM